MVYLSQPYIMEEVSPQFYCPGTYDCAYRSLNRYVETKRKEILQIGEIIYDGVALDPKPLHCVERSTDYINAEQNCEAKRIPLKATIYSSKK